MKLNLRTADLARVKYTYQIFFGHLIPYAIYQMHEPGELTKRLDKAIRDMKPLGEFKPSEFIFPHEEPQPELLPLSVRALARWRYMQQY